MSQIPQVMNGLALEHDFVFEPGKGLAAKGQSALMTALSGATSLLAFKGEAVDMANAAHALLVTGTAASGETTITSNVLFVDPNGGAQILTLPAESASTGLLLVVFNAANAAEAITVEDDGTSTIVTLAQNEGGLLYCNGTAWRGFVGGIT